MAYNFATVNLQALLNADSAGDFRSVPLLHLPEALPPAQHLAQKINDFVLQQLPPLPPPLSPTAPLGHVLVTPSGLGLAHVSREGHACKQLLGGACTLREGMPACDLGAALTGHAVWIFPGHTDAPLSGQRTLAWTKEGRPEATDPDAVVDAVRPHARGGTLRCVVLNGCDSLGLGLQLVDAGVQSVICFETRAHDEAALWFGVGFARAIAQGHDPRAAFEAARAVVRAITTPDSSGGGFVPKFALVSPATSAVDESGRLGPEAGEAAGRIPAGVPVLLLQPLLSSVMPAPDPHLIAQPAKVREIVDALAAGGAGITSTRCSAGVHGMGGAGKSTLAASVARDPRAHGSVCPDGVEWLEIGNDESKKGLAVLQTLVRQLSCLLKQSPLEPEPEEWKQLPGLERARRQLEALLASKRVLIVADDVWEVEQVLPIREVIAKTGADGSRMLITTRIGAVLRDTRIAATPFAVDLLNDQDSYHLMASWAGEKDSEVVQNEQAREVAARCGVGKAGGLPLALRSLSVLVEDYGWDGVLGQLESEFADDTDPSRGALRVSFKMLDRTLRERYEMLTIFMEDERIPLDILQRLWGLENKRAVLDRTLVSLLRRSMFVEGGREQGYVKLHDIQREILPGTDDPRVVVWHAEVLRRCSTQIGVEGGGYWMGADGRRRFVHHAAKAALGGEYGELAQVEQLDLSHLKTLTELPVLVNMTGLASIRDEAFSDCESLREITLPVSITSIGNRAFDGCSSLLEITLPVSITSIGDCAFRSCSSLLEITPPVSITSIGDSAFRGCSSLLKITLPVSITSIGDSAFRGCSSLLEITLPDSLTSIGWGAFYGCSSLRDIALPDGLTSIGDCAFRDCPLDAESAAAVRGVNYWALQPPIDAQGMITLPESLTSIGDCAFRGCSSMGKITLPDSLTSIGRGAFVGCSSLLEITLPDGLTSISSYAFKGCSSLREITLPNSLTSIGDCAFEGCSSLLEITLPDSLTIGNDAFYGCSSLREITLPDSLTSIGNRAFDGCSDLRTIKLPDSLTSIGELAFHGCSSLGEITLPNSLTSIGNRAFDDCSSLREITLPDSLTSIGGDVFRNCSSLSAATRTAMNLRALHGSYEGAGHGGGRGGGRPEPGLWTSDSLPLQATIR